MSTSLSEAAEPLVRALVDTLVFTAAACSINLGLLANIFGSILDNPLHTATVFKFQMSILIIAIFILLETSNVASLYGVFQAVRRGRDGLGEVQWMDSLAAIGYRMVPVLADFYCMSFVLCALQHRRRRFAIEPRMANLSPTDLFLVAILPGILMAGRAVMFGYTSVALVVCRAGLAADQVPALCGKLGGLDDGGVTISSVQCAFTLASIWSLRQEAKFSKQGKYALALVYGASCLRLMLNVVYLLGPDHASWMRPFDALKLYRFGEAEAAAIVAFAVHHVAEACQTDEDVAEVAIPATTPSLPSYHATESTQPYDFDTPAPSPLVRHWS